MSLKFLIVHESTVIKDILRKYIMADHRESVVDQTVSSKPIARMLEEEKYDLVFCGLEMPGMSGVDVRSHVRMSGGNPKTPVIIMTPTDNEDQRRQLAKQGVEHVLPIPFTSIQIRSLVWEVFNPLSESLKISEHIPRTRAIIQAKDQEIQAEVIHITMDRVVCDLVCPEGRANLADAGHLRVHFPVDYGKAIDIHITGDLFGLEQDILLEGKPSRRHRLTWKIAWHAFELTTATNKTLKMPLGKVPVPCVDFHEKFDAISARNASLSEENETLKTAIDNLIKEKQELSLRISQLETKVSELRKTEADVSLKRVSLSALINEVAKQSKDPSKLPIFRQIIEDNVKLRKGRE